MYNTSGNSSNQRVVSGQNYVNAFWQKEQQMLNAAQGCDNATVQPAQYTSWTPAVMNPHYGLAMDNKYPNQEDMAALTQRSSFSSAGNGGSACGMNIDNLMPASWRKGAPGSMGGAGGGSCANLQSEQQMWSKYSPSRGAYSNYITAAGSARLTLNTRSALNRTIGLPNLLRQGPAVPISSQAVLFNDSGYRQDSYYNAVGAYPQLTSC
jgi:hypothetical protein